MHELFLNFLVKLDFDRSHFFPLLHFCFRWTEPLNEHLPFLTTDRSLDDQKTDVYMVFLVINEKKMFWRKIFR